MKRKCVQKQSLSLCNIHTHCTITHTHTHAHIHTVFRHLPALPGNMRRLSPGDVISSSDVAADENNKSVCTGEALIHDPPTVRIHIASVLPQKVEY